ncbi:amino acid adenylation domain-containing protein [Pectobacterium parvum]|nr:amino acid adenylation domain-containing protein [Pectobacterium parvum]
MEMLNIGFVSDLFLGESFFEDVMEYGHQVCFFSESSCVNTQFDFIVTTENYPHKIELLKGFSKNIILIASNKDIVSDSDFLEKAEFLFFYSITQEDSGCICKCVFNEKTDKSQYRIKWVRDQLTDITVEFSRGGVPDDFEISNLLDEKFFAETPERLGKLIPLLLRRFGDQTDGGSASDFAYHIWLPDTDFSTVNTSTGNPPLYHFFFNETGALRKSRYVQTRTMISIHPQGNGALIKVMGDDFRFQYFTRYLSALLVADVDPVYAPIVVEPEELAQLSLFNSTEDKALLKNDVITLFRNIANEYPTSIALHTDVRSYSYGELDSLSDKMACWLQEQSGQANAVIAVSMQKSAQLLIVLLGILKSNKTYVLLDPQAPAARNQHILNDVRPVLILAETLLQAGESLCLHPDNINFAQIQVDNRILQTPAEGLAYICYTSGTTGKPKGVMVTRVGLSNLAQNHRDFIGLKLESRVLCIASLGFDAFGWDIFGAFVSGSAVYLAPDVLHSDVTALHQYLVKNEIGHVTLTPAILELLPHEDWHGLRSMIVMGDAPPADVIAWWSSRTRLCNGYGPTEATIATSLCEYRDGVAWNCIGKPLKNYRCYILDAQHNFLPIGFEGELCIAGVGLAHGYLNEPALSDEKFVMLPLPGNPYPERIYKTGDIAKWDEQGNIVFIGRKDNQVKIRGVRIEIGEIEAAIRRHPQVESVCVVASKQRVGKVLVAFVQPSSSTLQADILRYSLITQLHSAAIPSAFVFLSTLPLTVNGKVDRRQLENRPLEDADSRVAKAETETEALLERIVADAIGCAYVDVTQDFISLGAHSLTMSRIVALTSRDLHCRLNLADIFQHNTIRSLAEYIDEQATVAHTTVLLSEERRAPLNPQQNLLWYLSALNPDDCSYNLPVCVEICGPLDLELFEDSVNFVYEKHESLRTIFGESQGVAYQYAKPHVSLKLCDYCIGSQYQSLDALVKSLCATPFDITERPPVILRLVQFDEAHHVLI